MCCHISISLYWKIVTSDPWVFMDSGYCSGNACLTANDMGRCRAWNVWCVSKHRLFLLTRDFLAAVTDYSCPLCKFAQGGKHGLSPTIDATAQLWAWHWVQTVEVLCIDREITWFLSNLQNAIAGLCTANCCWFFKPDMLSIVCWLVYTALEEALLAFHRQTSSRV